MEDQILKLIQDIGNNGENIGPEQELLESGIWIRWHLSRY